MLYPIAKFLSTDFKWNGNALQSYPLKKAKPYISSVSEQQHGDVVHRREK